MNLFKRIVSTILLIISMIGGLINPMEPFENAKYLFSDPAKASYLNYFMKFCQMKQILPTHDVKG